MLFTKCWECDEPIPFSPIDFIGYNPGTSGHLFHSKIEAEEVLELTKQAIRDTGYKLFSGVICNDDSILNNVLAAEIEIKL